MKRQFLQRLSKSGHASYNVVLAPFMLHQIRPDLGEIKPFLEKAIKHGSHGAIYFNIMLEVLSSEGSFRFSGPFGPTSTC